MDRAIAIAIADFVPKRLSVNDVDYDHRLGNLLEVWLNGREQDRVVAFDRIEGWVERYVLSGFGEIQIECDRVKTEKVYGDVCVRWKVKSD